MTRHTCTHLRFGRATSGFTLTEVLFGVIILALGLLGVGAVIPGVIAQQRVANESALAVNALNEAEQALTENPALWSIYETDSTGAGTTQGLGQRLLDPIWSADQEWDVSRRDIDLMTGDLRVPPPGMLAAGAEQAVYFQADRLWPKPPHDGTPKFIWDVVFRRSTPSDPTLRVGPHRVQMAIFLRRVDPGIKLSPGAMYTLYEALEHAAGVSGGDYRLAAAADSAGMPTFRGVATGGLLRYSVPITLDVTYDDMYRDRIRLQSSQFDPTITPEQVFAVGSKNQIIVDNLGTVYRVKNVTSVNGGSPTMGSDILLFVDPPVGKGVESSNSNNPATLFQIAATVQPPVAVRVIDMVIQDEVVTYGTGSGLR
ncbi:MAG: hypothetical protein H6815_13985 [Phycisphaeraceae bacterium]|nr:hypothetical protein [Phycisphaerales bacterium]MCB9861549.1 hypothetical protein [Phycisphaeraceae bacterium]